MLGKKLQAIFEYLEEAVDPNDHEGRAKILDRQCAHVASIIDRMQYSPSPQMADMTRCLAMLKMDSCPFSKEQVKVLKDKINASANDCPTRQGAMVQQSMDYIHEYLPQDQWKIVLADDADSFVVLDVVTEVLSTIQLGVYTQNPILARSIWFVSFMLSWTIDARQTTSTSQWEN